MKIWKLAPLLVLCSLCWGQGSRFESNVFTSSSSVPPGANSVVYTVPFAQVKVCGYPATGSPCTNVVNVYSDPALTQPIQQPIKADVHGRFGFWAAGGMYSYSITNPGVLGTFNISLAGPGGGQATFQSEPGIVYAQSVSTARKATVADFFAMFVGTCTGTAVPQANGTCGVAGTGSVTGFTAPSGNWPTWLVPTVLNPTTAPALSVAAGPIPNAALANSSVTINSTACALGGTCTIPLTGVSSINGTPGPYTFTGSVSCASGTCNFTGGSMVYPGAGIPNSTGSAWGTSYDASNKLPATFLPVATTGAFGAVKPDGTTITITGGVITATTGGSGGITQLTGDVTTPSGSGSQAATLATVNGSPGACGDSTHVCQVTTNGKGLVTAQSAVSIAAGGISGLTTGKIPVATSSTAIGNSPLDTTTNASAVTSSQDFYAPALHSTDTSGAGFGWSGTEGTAPSGTSGVDGFWADSTAHRWLMNNNNAGAVKVVGAGTAGTSGHIPVFSSNGIDIQDSGAAGFTGSCAPTTTLTVVNGIITGCS